MLRHWGDVRRWRGVGEARSRGGRWQGAGEAAGSKREGRRRRVADEARVRGRGAKGFFGWWPGQAALARQAIQAIRFERLGSRLLPGSSCLAQVTNHKGEVRWQRCRGRVGSRRGEVMAHGEIRFGFLAKNQRRNCLSDFFLQTWSVVNFWKLNFKNRT